VGGVAFRVLSGEVEGLLRPDFGGCGSRAGAGCGGVRGEDSGLGVGLGELYEALYREAGGELGGGSAEGLWEVFGADTDGFSGSASAGIGGGGGGYGELGGGRSSGFHGDRWVGEHGFGLVGDALSAVASDRASGGGEDWDDPGVALLGRWAVVSVHGGSFDGWEELDAGGGSIGK